MDPVSLIIAGSVAAAPALAGLRRLWAWWKGESTEADPTRSARYALGSATEVIAALPSGWERWGGARPELRGAPQNSILAVRGLAEHPPIVRATLLDVAEELGIPVDSLATVIAHESNGWKADAKNPLGAYGLIQLTKGANLPGFTDAGALAAVPLMPAVDQLTQIVLPYYRRMPSARGADIGRLAMLNFLPAFVGKPDDFVLSRKGENVYQANAGFDRANKGAITVGDVYASFANVAKAAGGRRIAVDGRMLDGQHVSVTVPAATKAPARLPPAPQHAKAPATTAPPRENAPDPTVGAPEDAPPPEPPFSLGHAPIVAAPSPAILMARPDQLVSKVAPALPSAVSDAFAAQVVAGCARALASGAEEDEYRPLVTAAGTSVRGLLLAAVRAGTHKPIAKMELEVPDLDLVVTILRDALQAQVDGRWLRLGVTYHEQIEICRLLGLISPTQEIVTAAWEAARDAKRTIQPVGLVQSAADFPLMDSIAFAIRHNDNIEKAIERAGFGPDDFIRPYGKAWIVHPRQVEPDKTGVVRGVVEFGWQQPNGKPIQGPGSGGHDADYSDYSMVTADLCERRARRLSTGETVDLVNVYRALFPGEAMAEVIEVYR